MPKTTCISVAFEKMAAKKNWSIQDKSVFSHMLCHTAPTKKAYEEMLGLGVQCFDKLTRIETFVLSEYAEGKLEDPAVINNLKSIWREMLEA